MISRNFFTVWKIIDFPISQIIFATTFRENCHFSARNTIFVIKMTTKSFLLFFREINSKMDSFPTQNENTSKSTTSITRSFLTKNTKKKPQARKKKWKTIILHTYYTTLLLQRNKQSKKRDENSEITIKKNLFKTFVGHWWKKVKVCMPSIALKNIILPLLPFLSLVYRVLHMKIVKYKSETVHFWCHVRKAKVSLKKVQLLKHTLNWVRIVQFQCYSYFLLTIFKWNTLQKKEMEKMLMILLHNKKNYFKQKQMVKP